MCNVWVFEPSKIKCNRRNARMINQVLFETLCRTNLTRTQPILQLVNGGPNQIKKYCCWYLSKVRSWDTISDFVRLFASTVSLSTAISSSASASASNFLLLPPEKNGSELNLVRCSVKGDYWRSEMIGGPPRGKVPTKNYFSLRYFFPTHHHHQHLHLILILLHLFHSCSCFSTSSSFSSFSHAFYPKIFAKFFPSHSFSLSNALSLSLS